MGPGVAGEVTAGRPVMVHGLLSGTQHSAQFSQRGLSRARGRSVDSVVMVLILLLRSGF